MKKFIFLIIFIFLSLGFTISDSGGGLYFPTSKGYTWSQTSQQYETEWQLTANACYGCGSAYFLVSRSVSPNQYGNFEYVFWLFSNSYFKNGTYTGTQVTGIDIKYWDSNANAWLNAKNFYVFDATDYIDNPSNNLSTSIYRFYSSNPNQSFYIGWSSVKPI